MKERKDAFLEVVMYHCSIVGTGMYSAMNMRIPIFTSLNTLEETECFRKQPYIDELPLANARTKFSHRAKMFNVAFNFKNQGDNAQNLWKCSSCQSSIETQEHVLFCPAYSQLRQGKDLKSDRDLTDYLMKVLIIREKLNINK